MTEKQIQSAIEDYIRALGGVAIRTQSGVIRQNYETKSGDNRTRFIHLAKSGTADLIAMINGFSLAIEVKKDEKEVEKWLRYPYKSNGKPCAYDKRIEEQKEFMQKWTENKGTHILTSSLSHFESDTRSLGIIK